MAEDDGAEVKAGRVAAQGHVKAAMIQIASS
jgi:hypothetical protein